MSLNFYKIRRVIYFDAIESYENERVFNFSKIFKKIFLKNLKIIKYQVPAKTVEFRIQIISIFIIKNFLNLC